MKLPCEFSILISLNGNKALGAPLWVVVGLVALL